MNQIAVFCLCVRAVLIAACGYHKSDVNATIQHISVFCPRVGLSLQAQEPRLQFCRRRIFHCTLGNQGCSFTRDWIGMVASHCFPHPILSLASEQTLKDRKKIPEATAWRWGKWNWLTGPTGLHRNSQGLNISSIRFLIDQRSGNSNHPSPPAY